MEEHNKHIDDLFKKGLGSYAEAPPPAVWDALEKRLDGKQKKRGFFYPWFISLLLLSGISLLGGTIWKLSNNTAITSVDANPPKEKALINTTNNSDNQTNNSKDISDLNTTANNSKDIKKKKIAPNTTAQNKPQHEIAMLKTNSAGAARNIKEPENHISANEPSENATKDNNTNEVASKEKANNEEYNKQAINETQSSNREAAKDIRKTRLAKQNPKEAAVPEKTTGIAKSNRQADLENTVTKKNDDVKKARAERDIKNLPVATKILPAASAGNVPAANAKTIANNANVVAASSKSIAIEKQALKGKAIEEMQPVAKEGANAQKGVDFEKTETVGEGTQALENKEAGSREYVSLSKIEPMQSSFEKKQANFIAKPVEKARTIENREIAGNDAVVAGTFKENAVASSSSNSSNALNVNNAIAGENIAKALIDRVEAGVKIGYEGSLNSGGARKFVGAFYVQYNLSRKFALMLQPAIKSTHLNYQSIGSQNYYKEHNDSAYTVTPTTPVQGVNVETGQPDTTAWIKTYTFSQTHDSIVKSYEYGGTNIEVELPVLLKYNVSSKLSVYGGVNIIYNKTYGASENTYTNAGILRKTDTLSWWPFGGAVPPAPSASSVLKYSGASISSYTGPLYAAQTSSVIRLGYMFGMSYEFRKRWLFDLLVQQGSAT